MTQPTAPDGTQPTPAQLASQLAARADEVLAHAWMVRTFVKHSEEAEDFPELMDAARAIFDLCRAVEAKAADPVKKLKFLKLKLKGLRAAADAFREDAPAASDHMNFRQAVVSLDACVAELDRIVAAL